MAGRTLIGALLAVAAGVSMATPSSAAVVFDDYIPGVSWQVDWGGLNTASVYSGAHSVQADSGNGQVVLLPLSSYLVADAPLFDFYVNSTGNTAVTVEIRINNNHFSNNGGGVYLVDGATQTGNLTTDADSSTWQHVTFDVTQPRWYWGNGWESTNLTPTDAITRIYVGSNAGLLMDAVQFTSVPEPTSLSIVGLAGMALLKRRR